MYIGIAHTHTLIVVLYLIQLFIKVVLLGAKKDEALEKFSQKSKIPHMVLATLMVLTGLALMFIPKGENIPAAYTSIYIWVKFAIVMASIPLGIIGMKKRSVGMLAGALVLMLGAMGIAYAFDPAGEVDQSKVDETREMIENDASTANLTEAEKNGKAIYTTYCVSCHGEDGALGSQGAKNLGESQLSEAEMKEIILNGKGIMPGFANLSEEDLADVIAYTNTFKK